MAKIRLKSVTIGDFRSFLGEHEVSFVPAGLVNLEGINHDTNGSSGSGKSSVAHALAYVFGFCPIPATELTCWDAPGKSPTVKLTFTVDDILVRVSRGKKLSLQIDGVEFDGSAKQKEEELTRLVGLSPEMLATLTYRGQRKPGLFLDMTDSEKKEFLTQVLGLERFEKAADAAAKRMSDLQMQAVGLGATVASLEEERASLPEDRTAEIEAEVADIEYKIDGADYDASELRTQIANIRSGINQKIMEVVGDLPDRLEIARRNLKEVHDSSVSVVFSTSAELERLNELFRQCRERLTRAESDDKKRETDLAMARRKRAQEISELNAKATSAPLLLSSKTDKEVQLVVLRSRVCPTCERAWDEGDQEEKKLVQDLAVIDGRLEQISVALERAAVLEAEMDVFPIFEPSPGVGKLREMVTGIQVKIGAEKVQISANNKAAEVSKNAQYAASAAILTELELEGARLTSDVVNQSHKEIEALDLRARAEESIKSQELRELGLVRAQLAQAQADAARAAALDRMIALKKSEHEKLTATAMAERDFAAVVGREGFLGSIFDEILAEITEETNRVLGAVANTRHVTLQFKSENVTQKGVVKKEIKPLVCVSGRDAPLRSGLSGGMFSTVELAVDLAVGEVISRRSGTSPGWLVLDETFDGLDPVSKESCLEILQEYAQDRLVLVVDHMSETKGFFTKKMVVEYKAGESRFASN